MTDRPRYSGRVPRPAKVLERVGLVSRDSEREPSNAELAGRIEYGFDQLRRYVDDTVSSSERRLADRIGDVQAEVGLLRATQIQDHAPRILAVEQRTPTQKVQSAALCAGRYTAYFTLLAVGARMAAKAFPQYGGAIEEMLKALGL